MALDEVDHEEDGAARAFAELRAEVSVLRRAVEALPAAIEALEAPDYGPSFGSISQGLGEVESWLAEIAEHPALALTPEQHARAIERAGAEIVREASKALRDETDAIGRERRHLAAIVGQAAAGTRQRRQRFWFSGGGLAFGLMLFPLLAAVAPGGSYLAALSTGHTDRWRAGSDLMQAADPGGSAALATASRLVNANTETLQTCAEVARKAGQAQKCTISVAAPGR